MRSILIAAVLAVTSSPLAADPCPSVLWSSIQTISGYVQWVESLRAIDYDHDGKLDLVGLVRGEFGSPSILHSWRGVGNGTFEAAVSLGTDLMEDVEVANVNNDAYLDLVGASYSQGIFVRLGNASGGFDVPLTTSVNYGPSDVFLANLNNDSYPDLVASSFSVNTFVLYAGAGDGTFTEIGRQSIGGSWEIWRVVAGDFDGDTYVDVAVIKRSSSQVVVYFRNTNGTFNTFGAVTLSSGAAGELPRELAVADLDEDGDLDLVSTTNAGGTIDIFFNQGGRIFAPRTSLAGRTAGTLTGVDQFTIVDINGDAHLDILAGGVNSATLVTYLGQGDGTFATASFSTIPDSAASIATGNFDTGDADLEVAMGSSGEFMTAGFTCETHVHLYSIAGVVTSGQPAKLRATISGFTSAMSVPLGTVTFKESSTVLGTDDVDAAGTAMLDYSGFPTGDHTVTAEFSGNATLPAATSSAYLQRVTNDASSITMGFNSSTHGKPFDLFVSIRNRFNSATTGSYFVTVDGVTESTPRHSSSPQTLTLSAGAHTIAADYAGNASDPGSTSPTYNLTTAKTTITSLGATCVNGCAQRQGTAHQLRVTAVGSPSPNPTGTVEILLGTTSYGTAPLVNGVATLTVTLPRGSNQYKLAYSGDGNYLSSGSATFTLEVLPNPALTIDAHSRHFLTWMAIPAVVPEGTTSTTLYRRVHGTESWSIVSNWSLSSPADSSGLTPGVLYDYRLDAVVGGQPQQSNIDSALVFTDPALFVLGIGVKLAHFTELRDTLNVLRGQASLAPFAFDGTFGAQMTVRASHLTALRNAVAETRAALGMPAFTFSDASPAGEVIRRAHMNELRDAVD